MGTGIVGLLRIAEAGGHVDRRPALAVVRGHGPGDRLPRGVDGRELTGDEPLERVTDLKREGAGHRLLIVTNERRSAQGPIGTCAGSQPIVPPWVSCSSLRPRSLD